MMPIVLFLILFVTSCGDSGKKARVSMAEIQIRSYGTALDMFKYDCGRFPSTAEGLMALNKQPTNMTGTNWHGPYLDSIPKDPWERDYVYRYPGVHNTNRFDLYSCGPDGVSKSGGDDADDISYWRMRHTVQ